MLNDVIRNKIEYPEMRVLYDSRMTVTFPVFQREVRAYIQRLRQKYSNHGIVDPLIDKATRFKNDGSWYKARIVELEKAILVNKVVPEEFKGTWRSIEFEFLFKNIEAEKDFIAKARCKKWAKHLHLKTDGSLADPNNRECSPREIAFSYRSGEENSVRELCELLKNRAYTNKTCGTHVHFDMRHVDEPTVKLYGQRLARAVPALKTILPASRRDSKYCKEPIGYFEDQDRYKFVNLTAYRKHSTIEVRAHGGTINANKILNWVRLCEIIMTSRVRSKNEEISSLDELITLYQLDESLGKYLKKRHDKFNGNNSHNEEDIPELNDTQAPTAAPVMEAHLLPAAAPQVQLIL